MRFHRTKKAGRLVAGSFLLVLVGLVVLEFGGRGYVHLRYGVPGKHYGRWRSDRVLGARMAESVYDHRWQTNDWGFRNDEDVVTANPLECERIIAYGGSTTLCWNLSTPDTWPAQVEAILREATGQSCHQVLNAGDILWSLSHVYARAKIEIPELKPDYVLLYTGINEVGHAMFLKRSGRPIDELVANGEYGRVAHNLPQNFWLVRNSFAYKVLHKLFVYPLADYLRDADSKRWARLLATEIGPGSRPLPPDPAVLENYLYVLEKLILLCQQYDSEPVFVIQASGLSTVGHDHMTAYSREGAKLAEGFGIRVIDAQSVVTAYDGDPADLFRDSGIHWSARGSSLLAEAIYAGIYTSEHPEPTSP